MKNYKTAPFDLEKALAGHMLVDGFGTIYTHFRNNHFPSKSYPFIATDESGEDETFTPKGYQGQSDTSNLNLSLYIPLTKKELALQKLDEAMILSVQAINEHSGHAKLDAIRLNQTTAYLESCKKIISSLPETTQQ